MSETKSKVLLFGSILKLKSVDYSIPLQLGPTHLDFVDKYTYLGVTLDKHMSLTHFVSDVKKKVTGQLFKLRKLRKMITPFCAISIYKQTILPFFDYCGFLLQSINVSDRSDLQVLQNDALRTCYNVRRRDKMSIKKLHADAKLLSLEQRRLIQLLSLMYNHEKKLNVRRVPVRATRNAARFTFYTERYNNLKYKNSPHYIGAERWNALPLSTIDSETLFEFKKNLKQIYRTYKS